MNDEGIYWTFTAAAQSIAAFVALLLAGYAVIQSLMDSARERDDSLDEVHDTLRAKYHQYIIGLAWITGSAIVLSLLTVYSNRWDFALKFWLVGFTSFIDFAAVVAGLYVVVSMVNPRKYERAAEKTLKEQASGFHLSGKSVSRADFFDAFLHLEQLVRDYLRRTDLYVASRGVPRMSFSFRQMIEALLQNERIDRDFFDELLDVNKYRNLVFHGHVETADAAMIARTIQSTNRIQQMLDSLPSQQ
jgi:hypothetical protein